MTMENTPAQRSSSAVGTLGKRVVAWLVVAAAVIIALKLIIGAVMGFVTFASDDRARRRRDHGRDVGAASPLTRRCPT